MTKPGKATIARLNRTEGKYRMTIIPTEFVELPEEKMAETTKEWPHVFAKLPFDHQIFLDRFDANHCHAVYGDHVESLGQHNTDGGEQRSHHQVFDTDVL